MNCSNSAITSFVVHNNSNIFNTSPSNHAEDQNLYNRTQDAKGAACYIIAVLLVYSISIVALIMSRIKRKHVKLLEDREIHKYLREFQIVKEKSTRDSYHDMKKAIMARLTNNRDHKSNTNNNPTLALSHNSSCASLTTMGRSSVFPLLNVAMMQFQSSLMGGGMCGCNAGDNCPHVAGNVKFKRNQTMNTNEVLGPTSVSSSSSFFTSYITKQVLSGAGGACGTPTLETVFESYDGENETSFSFDLKKNEMKGDEESESSLPPQTASDMENFIRSTDNKSEWKKAETKIETKIKNNKFSFDFGGKPFGLDDDSKETEQGLIVSVAPNEDALITGAGMQSSLEEVQVQETVTKQSRKKETLFESDQKINWIEIDESKMTIRKKMTTSETSCSISGKRPRQTNDAAIEITSTHDKPSSNDFNSASCHKNNEARLGPYYKNTADFYFQKSNPLNDFKNSSATPIKILTTDKSDYSRSAKPFINEPTFSGNKTAVKVNQSMQNKVSVTKVQPPASLSGGCLTLENPLKITDSFDSPAIESRSLNIFRHKMGIPPPKSEYKTDETLMMPAFPDKNLDGNVGGSKIKQNFPNIVRPIKPILKRNDSKKIANGASKNDSLKQNILIPNTHILNESDEKPPLPLRNVKSTYSPRVLPDRPNWSQQQDKPDNITKNPANDGLDGFNMAKLEKLLLMRGNIKFADDSEERKHDESLVEPSEKKSVVTFENENMIVRPTYSKTKARSNQSLSKQRPEIRKAFDNSTSDNTLKYCVGNNTLSSDYCSEDPYDYEDYAFGRNRKDSD